LKSRNSLPLYCVAAILLISGCTRLPEAPVHNADLLERMAEVRSHSSGHSLLVSKSGFMACLPYSNASTTAEQLPVDGLYYKSLRLIQGWQWKIDGKQWNRKDIDGAVDLIRPDKIERAIAPELFERLILSPDLPVCILEINSSERQKKLELELMFDLRPIGLARADYSSRYDADLKQLIVGNPLYGYIAVGSSGEWFDMPRRERRDFDHAYIPLDKAATISIPGSFLFRPTEETRVCIAFAGTESAASKYVQGALKDPESLCQQSSQFVLEFLNRTPVLCEDKKLEAALAWDRWLLFNHLSETNGINHFLPFPPLGLSADVAIDARALPAWFWVTAGDTSLENILDASITSAADSLPDPEEALFALTGWADWMNLTGRSSAFEARIKVLSSAFHKLGSYANKHKKRMRLEKQSRWEEKLYSADLPVPPSSSFPGVNVLYSSLLDRVVRWDKYSVYWQNYFRNNASRSLFKGVKIVYPYDKIIRNDPVVWSEKEKTAWQDATNNPEFNLGYIEYALHGNRYDHNKYHLGRIINDDWSNELGYIWRFDDLYKNTFHTSPSMLVRSAILKERGYGSEKDFEALINPYYAVWYKIENRGEADQNTYQGKSPESTETIAERVRFFYEVILGLRINSRGRTLTLAPCHPLNIWENRSINTTINVTGEIITIDIDPFEGIYTFIRPGGDEQMTLDLRDLPFESKKLSIRAKLKRRGITVIKRGINKKGKPTLFVDGSEGIFTESVGSE